MQSVSSRIWTRVAVSISLDDNHYTTAPPFLHNTNIPPWKIVFFVNQYGSGIG